MSENPNLAPDINQALTDMELNGGIWWRDLPIGSKVRLSTRNTEYLLEKKSDGDYICGNERYCPAPTNASIHGSTFGGSMIRVGWLGIGMYLEFSTAKDGTITTSEIQNVQLLKAER